MKKYKYEAVNIDGKKFKGVFLAEDEHDLERKLLEQKLYVKRYRVYKATTPNAFFTVSGKVTAEEIGMFCRQFAIMITSGISILTCLDILRTQKYNGLLKKVLSFLYEDVKGGILLSEAMVKHDKIFPLLFRSMIHVGEVSGKLDLILINLADYYEADARMKKKVKGALVYPIFLIGLAIGIVALMIVYIIPTFIDAFASLDGVDMPDITLQLNEFGKWLQENWQTVFLYIFAIVLLGYLFFFRTKKGRYIYDMILFKMPLIGPVISALITSRFARSFGLLVDSGENVVDALETAKVVLLNKYVEKQFADAIIAVEKGETLTSALENAKIFPALIIQMVAVGEKTGTLGEVLQKASPFFDAEAERRITAATSAIQPMILIFIGAAVAILFYCVYSPMLQIMESLDSMY